MSTLGNQRDIAAEHAKVLLAKSDMDSHDKGIIYIAKVLRDFGMEVIFIRYRIAEEAVEVALQEDVDVIGLSFYGSGMIHDTSTVMKLLEKEGRDDIMVILGGTIPDEYVPELLKMGVSGVFRPGSPTKDVVQCITSWVLGKNKSK